MLVVLHDWHKRSCLPWSVVCVGHVLCAEPSGDKLAPISSAFDANQFKWNELSNEAQEVGIDLDLGVQLV